MTARAGREGATLRPVMGALAAALVVCGHVAMYGGGGRMSEAPDSRSEVRIVPVRASDFRGVRRFFP